MECTNCLNQINNPLLCRLCSLTLCSKSCMITHFASNHPNSMLMSPAVKLFTNLKYKKIETLTTLSPFIKPGIFLSEGKNNEEYSYDQLTPIKYNSIPFLLGSGSFGDVYLAEHSTSHVKVAIKKMSKKRIESCLGSLDVIRNEINIHSRLIHDHIIKLLNVNEDSQYISIILEFASKGNLFNVMQKTRGMSEDKAFKYFIQTTSAIHFLHQNHFIHRDIKPENLLLDDNDNIKLADFGWSNEVGNNRKRSTFCGTVEYMAPEIINKQLYDSAVDNWSLGILLYELIHGYSPFKAKDANQVMSNIQEHKVVIHKNISKECKDIIYKLLAFNPSERLKTNEVFTHPFVIKYAPDSIDSLSNNKLPYSNSAIYEKTLPGKVRRLDSVETKECLTTNSKRNNNAIDLDSSKETKQIKCARNLLLDFNRKEESNRNGNMGNEYSITQVESNSKKEKNKSSSVTKTRISIDEFLSITASPEKPKKKLVKRVNMTIHKKKQPLIGDNKENNSIIVNCTSNNSKGISNKVIKTERNNKKETYPDPSKLKDFFTKMLGF